MSAFQCDHVHVRGQVVISDFEHVQGADLADDALDEHLVSHGVAVGQGLPDQLQVAGANGEIPVSLGDPGVLHSGLNGGDAAHDCGGRGSRAGDGLASLLQQLRVSRYKGVLLLHHSMHLV